MSLEALLVNPGSQIYYDPKFMQVMVDHLEWFRGRSDTQQVSIPPSELHKFRFNLFGFLAHYNVPQHKHYLTLQLNGLKHDHDFDYNLTTLLIPGDGSMEYLQQRYQTNYNI